MSKHRVLTARAAVVGLAGLAAAAVPATAHAGTATAAKAGQSAADGATASFKGRKINLARTWEGAQSCAVVSKDDVRCHASKAEANAALVAAGLAKAPTAAAKAEAAPWPDICPEGWLCLYEDTEFYGRRLLFRDEGWQSLGGYGFKNQTSSWWNTQAACDDHGGLGDGVGGAIYISGCGARAERLGAWNDRAVDVGG